MSLYVPKTDKELSTLMKLCDDPEYQRRKDEVRKSPEFLAAIKPLQEYHYKLYNFEDLGPGPYKVKDLAREPINAELAVPDSSCPWARSGLRGEVYRVAEQFEIANWHVKIV